MRNFGYYPEANQEGERFSVLTRRGRHYGLYYDYIDDELDRHRSHYSDAIVFGDLFVPNSLTYRSPAVAGGSLGLLVEFNDADERGESIDERLELAGTYRAGAQAGVGEVLPRERGVEAFEGGGISLDSSLRARQTITDQFVRVVS